MKNITIIYSEDYEVQRIENTLSKLGWYKNNKYNIFLPEKLVINSDSVVSKNEIKELVKEEYNENDYKTQEVFLLENFHKIVDEMQPEFSKTSLNLLDEYKIYFTKYGVGGSYNLPNSIIINIRNKWNVGILRTIFHEMIHLMIQPWIVEYQVGHWQKERVVDLLFLKFIPRLAKQQQVMINTENLDNIFNEYYPNVELLIKNIGQG